MSSNRPVEFANFVCTFGDKVLMDYAEEIVIPAFLVEGRERTHGASRFLLLNVQLLALPSQKGTTTGVVCGRFVRDTTLSRDQYLDNNNNLIKDKKTIEAAPSAIFALILNNHQLIYLSETPYAPTLKMFEATMRQFLGKAHGEYLQRLHREDRSDEIAVPLLHITPLPSSQSVTDFLQKFEVLKHVEFEVAATNNNLDLSDFYKDFRAVDRGMKSTKSKIVFDSPKGLDKQEAGVQVAYAAQQGINKVQVRGTDKQGEKLIGTNEEIKVKTFLDVAPGVENVKPVATQMVAKLAHFAGQGTLTVTPPSAAENKAVGTLLSTLNVPVEPSEAAE